MPSVKLYSYWRSSCSWRVRIALALKGVKYEYSAVHLIKNDGEQRTEEYRSLNPMKQVPSLVVDGNTITQSMAIIEYLEEKYPEVKLFPTDLDKRTKVREACEIINSGIQPLQNLVVLQYLEESKRSEWSRHWIEKGFEALESFLTKTAGQYCVGEQVTAADAFLVPQVFNANRNNVDMSKFPTISRIEESLRSHEAFIAAHPSNQPDNPERAA